MLSLSELRTQKENAIEVEELKLANPKLKIPIPDFCGDAWEQQGAKGLLPKSARTYLTAHDLMELADRFQTSHSRSRQVEVRPCCRSLSEQGLWPLPEQQHRLSALDSSQ